MKLLKHQKKFITAILAALFLQGTYAVANIETVSRFEKQMDELDVDTVFIAPGETIDDQPVWSQDGHWLAFNNMGNWIAVNLDRIEIKEAEWAGITIGATFSASEVKPLSEGEAQKWVSMAATGDREVSLRTGQTIFLRSASLGTQFIFRNKDGDEKEVWKTELANCFGLALSPDQKFVSLLCPSVGILVQRLP